MKISRYCYAALQSGMLDGFCNIQMSFGNRATGKSSAHHLKLISQAMSNPEHPVKVYSDHHNSRYHNKWAFDEVIELIHKLGYDWFVFNFSQLTITYKPYVEVRQKVTWEIVS